MQRPIFVARLIGPMLAVVGIGMLANGEVYHQLAAQFIRGYPFIYFSGLLAMAAGLAILNSYHEWTADWRSLITAFGWLLLGVGTFRLLAPQFVAFLGGAIAAHNGFFLGAGIVLLALGGFITFKGYVT